MHELPTGTVTLLFVTVKGSARLLEQEDERSAGVLKAFWQLVRTVSRNTGGHEVDAQDDTLLVALTRATDAVAAAVAVQLALAAA